MKQTYCRWCRARECQPFRPYLKAPVPTIVQVGGTEPNIPNCRQNIVAPENVPMANNATESITGAAKSDLGRSEVLPGLFIIACASFLTGRSKAPLRMTL